MEGKDESFEKSRNAFGTAHRPVADFCFAIFSSTSWLGKKGNCGNRGKAGILGIPGKLGIFGIFVTVKGRLIPTNA